MRGIVEPSTISLIFFILLGLLCSIAPLGGAPITPNSFVIIAL